MLTSPLFNADTAAVNSLIALNPLGLLITATRDEIDATPLPLLLHRSATGGATVYGHFARANPQVRALEINPRALIVFSGPQGYISPSWFQDRSQAPTWNFVVAQLDVRVTLLPGEQAARESVERLTAAMEVGRHRQWSPDELGDRYDSLLTSIIAFEAAVISTETKFKLGQNERSDVLRDIIAGLDATGGEQLARLMRWANAHRLGS